MKGIVFNILEEVVTRDFGLETWDQILENAGAHGAYTSLGNYDDQQLFGLVGAASELTGKPANEVVRWFGEQMIPFFARLHPEFFSAHTDARSFLLTLTTIIHPELRKLHPDADVPDFEFDTSRADVQGMTYCSHRKLCALAEGLITGAAGHFGEVAEIQQPQCMLHGAAACQLEIRFNPA